MATYVLVHGAWHGGWCWQTVSASLRTAGHDVWAPTLSGVGQRRHLASFDIGLQTHVDDVVTAIEFHDLRDVVLVGHSYAGMVVTGVAAQLPRRLSRVVVVDGFLPLRGEAAIDLLPPHAAGHYRDSAAQGDGRSIPPRPMRNLGVTDEGVIDAVSPRLTPHPLRTYLDGCVAGLAEVTVRGTFLVCAGWATPFSRFAARAVEAGWVVREIDADHEAMFTAPGLLAAELAATVTESVAGLEGAVA